jgi:A/G-specific adenine glycosylase
VSARPRGSGPPARERLRAELLAWYRAHRRDLPWRRTRDPWAIWVSETMLQQTRVETVIPYWERFLVRFPDPGTLASADLDEVLGLWSGLGYYSRARNLKRAAEEVVTRFAGRVPADPEALQTLPGVGRYTAGAVASIAHDRPAPIVDGNVARVLARLLGIRDEIEGPAARARLWAEAEALAAGEAPGELNQALMELGALVCAPRAPRCDACPVSDACDARAAGDAETLPRRAPKRAPKRVHAVAALVERRGRALAVRRPARGLLGGLWELPGGEVGSPRAAGADALAALLRARTGLAVADVAPAGRLEYAFTHRTLRLRLFRCAAGPGRVRLDGWDAHRWVAEARFEALPVGTFTRRALDVVRGAGQARPVPDEPRTPGRFTLTDRGGGRLEGAASGLDRRRLVRLRAGDPPPDRELDLHGLRKDEARRALRAALGAALAAGERCVLVVHGRGTRSEAGAVLREALPRWLAEDPHGASVLGFALADGHAGGASYVLLRRRR